MAGNLNTPAAHGRRLRAGVSERRRATPQNRAVRRTLDVLGWAAELPAERHDEGRPVLRQARAEAISALRHDGDGTWSTLAERFAPGHGVIAVLTFLLGLGVGLSFGSGPG